MKYKILLSILIPVLSVSCNRDDFEGEDYEKIQLQQALLHTNDIFIHYFDYLTIEDSLKKKFEAKQLLLTLKDIDTFYNINEYNPLGLFREHQYDAEKKRIYNVKLISRSYGIA